MIPVKLSLQNFMCYRDRVPPLSFEGIRLACLAGDNGNGKSSLIDAITWALWGQSRARSDDELIYSGQEHMEVQFDFAVAEQVYRIVRKRSRPRTRSGQGQSLLELLIATGDGFKPISGNTIAQTQQKVIDILHMDYETFVNSAYLRQGHADEFTTQPPAQRKEVLGSILGLSRYDELEEKSREMARQQEALRRQLADAIAEINEELARKPGYEAEMSRSQAELDRVARAVSEQEDAVGRLRQQQEALEKQQVQLEQLDIKMRETAGHLASWEEQIARHRLRLAEYEEISRRRANIEEGFSRYAAARELAGELDAGERRAHSLEKQKSGLENRIGELSRQLNTEHQVMTREASRLEQQLETLPALKEQQQRKQGQLSELSRREAALQEGRRAVEALQARVNFLESVSRRLEQEIKEVTEKLDLLASQTEARCPLCNGELAEEGRRLIMTSYTAERREKANELEQNRLELARRQPELATLRQETVLAETSINREKTELQASLGIIQREIVRVEAARQQLSQAREQISAIEEQLTSRAYAAAEQRALEELERELAANAYDPVRHEQARRALAELEPFDQARRRLEEADRLIDQERDAAARADTAAAQLRQGLAADGKTREELARLTALLPQVRDDFARAEVSLKALAAQHAAARENVWQAKTKLERCAELETKKAGAEKQMAQAAREEGIFRELTRAFGKDGVQALLIEMALPDIEAEANLLLSRMTDNRMHVKFETQRETKKGSVRETLDITISDELGTRNYEMFSGGEAFRINFAIRIALSRLLAKRAGAPLPTLIVDEGFGTQDSTGLEKLKEAIASVQDDFEKILVITHIEELRNAFPVRIDVIKTPEGSTLAVS